MDKDIGYFYVLVLKKKIEDNSKWFPENLSIPLDRKEDVVLGVFIDKKCKNSKKPLVIPKTELHNFLNLFDYMLLKCRNILK